MTSPDARARKPVKRARSAGGVVFRRDGGDARILLLQHTSGKWMLPKGTIEEGEPAQPVALREVREAARISDVRAGADVGEERACVFGQREDVCRARQVRYLLR